MTARIVASAAGAAYVLLLVGFVGLQLAGDAPAARIEVPAAPAAVEQAAAAARGSTRARAPAPAPAPAPRRHPALHLPLRRDFLDAEDLRKWNRLRAMRPHAQRRLAVEVPCCNYLRQRDSLLAGAALAYVFNHTLLVPTKALGSTFDLAAIAHQVGGAIRIAVDDDAFAAVERQPVDKTIAPGLHSPLRELFGKLAPHMSHHSNETVWLPSLHDVWLPDSPFERRLWTTINAQLVPSARVDAQARRMVRFFNLTSGPGPEPPLTVVHLTADHPDAVRRTLHGQLCLPAQSPVYVFGTGPTQELTAALRYYLNAVTWKDVFLELPGALVKGAIDHVLASRARTMLSDRQDLIERHMAARLWSGSGAQPLQRCALRGNDDAASCQGAPLVAAGDCPALLPPALVEVTSAARFLSVKWVGEPNALEYAVFWTCQPWPKPPDTAGTSVAAAIEQWTGPCRRAQAVRERYFRIPADELELHHEYTFWVATVGKGGKGSACGPAVVGRRARV